jgi:pimeloyl-ACP methyl ester carboxylesterase
MHCRGDMATPFDEGRRLAGLIPGAEFVTLESQNHVLTADEPAWAECLRQIEHFVRTEREPAGSLRCRACPSTSPASVQW